MKIIFKMPLVLSLLLMSHLSFGKDLTDVDYKFDQTKVGASENSFHLLRSFVDYFYLISKANVNNLPTVSSLTSTAGLCVGDAHPENFGIIIKQNGSRVFTHNDVDDSGPAPVIYDLYRMMVSSRLYDPAIDLKKMLMAYESGLSNSSEIVPPAIQDMFSKSMKVGTKPATSKVVNNKIVRTPESAELTDAETANLNRVFDSLKNLLSGKAQLIDALRTSKVGGGSGGLLRFEMLIEDGGDLLHLELKTEITPSVYPVAVSIPGTAVRIANALIADQGEGPSAFYKVLTIDGHDMLMRPRFGGNVGFSLDKLSVPENESIIYYESYVLGQIHARSIAKIEAWSKSLQNLNVKDLEQDVDSMVNFFNQKFAVLKK